MGKAALPKKVKLFIGLIFKDLYLIPLIKKHIIKNYGPIDFESQTLDFNYTAYYEKEFGVNLKRKFFSFKKLILPDKITAIKIISNKLELKFSKNSFRLINLDPGYLNDAKLVLATTKDYSHRIYLKNGIYAEITLIFSGGEFRPCAWAYPDYQNKEYLEIFNQIRSIFMKQRK